MNWQPLFTPTVALNIYMSNLLLANPAVIEKMSRETTPELFSVSEAPQLRSALNLWKTARRLLEQSGAKGKPDHWRELMRLLANEVEMDEYMDTLVEIYNNEQISSESRTAALNAVAPIILPLWPQGDHVTDQNVELRQLLMLFKEVWNNWPEGRVVAHAVNLLINNVSARNKELCPNYE